MEIGMEIPQKLKIELHCVSSIPLLRIYPKDEKHAIETPAHPCL
jgi:hypothetical protein